MAIEVRRTNHELETLRINRPQERPRSKGTPVISVVIILLIAIALVAAGCFLYARTIGRPPTVQTMIVTPKAVGQSGILLTGSGYIVTRHKYIIIGTKILGQIVDEPIEEGQRVKVGDVLARIDDRDYQAQLRQAGALRDVAKANLQLYRSKAERARQLIGIHAISTDDLETAVNAAEVAQAELERVQAAVDYAKFNVNQCIISSPISGIVLKKYRELGDTINFGGQIQAGGGATDIAQLADTEDMRAEVDINETDIAKVGIGSPATVILDSYTDRQFDATLVKIYPEADRQKGTLKIEVQIDKPDLHVIKPEMSAKVSFLVSRAQRVSEPRLTLPKSAIKTVGTESYVWMVRDGTAKRQTILCGPETETGLEVKQGIREGDVIIIATETSLQDGLRVTTK